MTKKINLLLIAIISLFAFSCSSDDEGGNENSNSNLTGTYTISSIIASQPFDTNNDGNPDATDLTNIFNCNGLIIIEGETMTFREVLLNAFPISDSSGNTSIEYNCVSNPDDQGTFTSNTTGLVFSTTDFNGDLETIAFQIDNGNLISIVEIFTDNGGINATITYSR